MRVLVTSSAGFIGFSFVLRTLATRPDVNVTVLDAFTYVANPTNLEDADYEIIRGDVCDVELIDRLVPRPDAVAHFAAENHSNNSLVDTNPFVTTNVLGIVNPVRACATREVRLHHISTDEVSGDLAPDNPARFTAAIAYRPSNPYSASKAPTDHFVRVRVYNLGLVVAISSCSSNYGPRQYLEKLIPRQIYGLFRRRSPRVYGAGGSVQDQIHVDNHNDVVWAILGVDEVGETCLIGVNGERSNLDVVGSILEGFGRARSDFVHVTDRPGHDRHYAIDSISIRTLGWQPRYQDFSSGLAETIDWYRANESWWTAAYDTAEVGHAECEQGLQF